MANDTNNLYCQIFGKTSPFLRTKEIITWVKATKIKSSTTTNTTEEYIQKNNYILNSFRPQSQHRCLQYGRSLYQSTVNFTPDWVN